jgi:hypothetical protein
MRRSRKGVRQLHQALVDHAAGRALRVVDADGELVLTADGAQVRQVNDSYLRTAFPAAGTLKAPASPSTPEEKLQAVLSILGQAVTLVVGLVDKVKAVHGADGQALVETQGADKRHCDAWREQLAPVCDDLLVWGRLFQRRHGSSAIVDVPNDPDEFDATPTPEEDDVRLSLWLRWAVARRRPAMAAAVHASDRQWQDVEVDLHRVRLHRAGALRRLHDARRGSARRCTSEEPAADGHVVDSLGCAPARDDA